MSPSLDSPLRRRLAIGGVIAAALAASIAVPTPSQSAQHPQGKPNHPASRAAGEMHARGGRLVVPQR